MLIVLKKKKTLLISTYIINRLIDDICNWLISAPMIGICPAQRRTVSRFFGLVYGNMLTGKPHI